MKSKAPMRGFSIHLALAAAILMPTAAPGQEGTFRVGAFYSRPHADARPALRELRNAPRHAPEQSAASDPSDAPAVFRTVVRMVNLNVAVRDSGGRPLEGLAPDDFEVLENGIPQEVAALSADDAPFRLVLLLDLSGSTRNDREAMKEAARGFVRIARPEDQIAVYALADNRFQVVSRLSSDRQTLLGLIDQLPDLEGGSPIYDTLVLAYAEELRELPDSRNAIIVVTDGIDNRVYGTGEPSVVSFGNLRRAAREWNTLIYPVFLDPFTVVPPPAWALKARRQLQELAEVTGGRLFAARSIYDVNGIYPLVADELRSVYTLGYYPTNVKTDGSWRPIEVRVKQPEAVVRTRDGYSAR